MMERMGADAIDDGDAKTKTALHCVVLDVVCRAPKYFGYLICSTRRITNRHQDSRASFFFRFFRFVLRKLTNQITLIVLQFALPLGMFTDQRLATSPPIKLSFYCEV